MRYEILDAEGGVINTIVADEAFVEAAFPERWRVVEEGVEPAQSAPRRVTKFAFINRLTDAEYIGILSAAKEVVAVEAWVKKLEMVTPDPDGTSVDLDDPRTIAGMQALETAGLLAAGRAAEILA